MASRKHLLELFDHGSIDPADLNEALLVSGVRPTAERWLKFLEQLSLSLGALALSISLVFFVAYNWTEFGRFAKFALIEAAIVVSVVVYLFTKANAAGNSLGGKLSLLAASILLGALLALYGQTYQTGADPWQLFFNWALLILPWTVLSQFAPLWILFIALLNVSAILYYQTFGGVFGLGLSLLFGSGLELLWWLFFLNVFALIVWEIFAVKFDWLRSRWGPRLLASAGGTAITWLAMLGVLGLDEAGYAALLCWPVWLAAMYYVYRRKQPDLFMLAGLCLSGIVVIMTFVGRHFIEAAGSGGLLFLAFLIIGLGSWSAFWLKSVNEEFQQ